MLIAQVTDIHLGFQPDDPAELNRKRFDDIISSLLAMDPRPDLLLATGDLTEHGAVASYRVLKLILDTLPFPVLLTLGNHDNRANFRKVFGDVPVENGLVQYVHDAGPVRVIMLDTLSEGHHGGAFEAASADWLDAQLSVSSKPTMLVLHHPPIESGNGWMTEDLDAPWVKRLEAVVRRHPHIIRLVTGHLHRAIVTTWAGAILSVCPSSGPQVAIDFREIDPENPDGRNMIVAESPGFALHYWTGENLLTYFGVGGEHPVLARYNARMQPTVRHILSERVGASWGHG
jgi:3',5'-cyclic AMP phosphodiesterase CpdA